MSGLSDNYLFLVIFTNHYYIKQLLDVVFVIFGIIKVKVSVLSRSLRLITLTETLILLDKTKTEFNNSFIMHCLLGNNGKRIVEEATLRSHAVMPHHP